MMTPQDTYQCIAAYPGVTESCICDVRARCLQYKGCPNKSASILLDFDGAAHTYQTEKNEPQTPQSVDAIAVDHAQQLLILIEKKTWGQFLYYLPATEKADPAGAALSKLSTYDLKGKYESTRKICEHITKEKDLFLYLPHVFVFLTELSDKDPMAGFASMLTSLAYTSSTVDYTIQQPIVKGMKTHLSTVPCSKSRYLNCMELDSFIRHPY